MQVIAYKAPQYSVAVHQQCFYSASGLEERPVLCTASSYCLLPAVLPGNHAAAAGAQGRSRSRGDGHRERGAGVRLHRNPRHRMAAGQDGLRHHAGHHQLPGRPRVLLPGHAQRLVPGMLPQPRAHTCMHADRSPLIYHQASQPLRGSSAVRRSGLWSHPGPYQPAGYAFQFCPAPGPRCCPSCSAPCRPTHLRLFQRPLQAWQGCANGWLAHRGGAVTGFHSVFIPVPAVAGTWQSRASGPSLVGVIQITF